ncbi:pldh-t [Symbiodinium natans]|uniref:Pldh-t protein n=1 Tax=Symbiodinium natans TaxID=878477 RepID=A0A812I1R1_9DINO|nr:pldh-t [Symbiodinium natans]
MARLLLQSQIAYAPEVPGFYRRKKSAALGASHASEACDTYVVLNHDQVFLTPGLLQGIAWGLLGSCCSGVIAFSARAPAAWAQQQSTPHRSYTKLEASTLSWKFRRWTAIMPYG